MSNPPAVSTKLSNEKIRLVEDDEEENPIDLNDDGDNSLGPDEDEDDVDNDDDMDNEDDDIIDDDDEDDDIDINSDDDMDNALDNVPVSSNRVGKSKRSTVVQSLNVPVPPQFFAENNDGNETEDDGDMVSLSGNVTGDEDFDDDDDEDPETYLQKFDLEVNKDLLLTHHPNEFNKNDNEIAALCQITRNESNNIIDPLHKSIPFLTKYEKTRVLGQRAKQLNSGAKPYVVVPDHILDGYIIAQMELAQKRIPFVIERPIHGGGTEYWRVRDLEIL
jgi:DNA-directed RNA polymerase subunit K/omega